MKIKVAIYLIQGYAPKSHIKQVLVAQFYYCIHVSSLPKKFESSMFHIWSATRKLFYCCYFYLYWGFVPQRSSFKLFSYFQLKKEKRLDALFTYIQDQQVRSEAVMQSHLQFEAAAGMMTVMLCWLLLCFHGTGLLRYLSTGLSVWLNQRWL